MPLYREDLDARHACDLCPDGACEGEVYLHASCHPEVPTWVSYWADVLTVHCGRCGTRVASIVVASRRTDRPWT